MKKLIKSGLICAALALAAYTVLSTTGCAKNKKQAQIPQEYSGGGYTVSNDLTFSDIPVPKGFKLVRDQSYAFKDGQSRIALLRYKGKAKIDEISMFYQNTMQGYQWEEVKLIDYDKNIQQFVKENETCMVITEKTGGLFSKTLITIQLTPHQKGASMESEEPVYNMPQPAQKYQRKSNVLNLK